MRKRKTYTRSSAQSSFFGGYNLAIKNIRKNIEQLRNLNSYCPITEETYKLVLAVIEEIRINPKNNPNQ